MYIGTSASVGAWDWPPPLLVFARLGDELADAGAVSAAAIRAEDCGSEGVFAFTIGNGAGAAVAVGVDEGRDVSAKATVESIAGAVRRMVPLGAGCVEIIGFVEPLGDVALFVSLP